MKVFTEFFLRKCVNEHLKPPRCSAINETQVCDELDSSKHLDRVCALSQPCGRSMYDCTDSNDLDVCINNISIDQRYYYYHKSGEAGEYDGDKECQVQNLGEVSRSEVHTPLFGNRGNIIPFLCGSCKCVCEEEMYYINQAGAYADAKNDMVVTGAKFILRNNILEIHIQQGKLLPFGVIYVPPGGADSLEWIGPQKEDLEPISWEGARRILLSTEIETAVGEAVIGLNLKYGKLEHWSEKAIYLEVRTTDLDLKEGRVSGSFKEWFPLAFPERELNFTNAESPRHPPEFSNVTTETGATFRFTTSGGKDGGRGTIPYIDLRKVTSATPTPMSGAALQWRGIGGTGGFLGISLSTYNIVSFITDNKRSPSRMQQRDIQDQGSPT